MKIPEGKVELDIAQVMRDLDKHLNGAATKALNTNAASALVAAGPDAPSPFLAVVAGLIGSGIALAIELDEAGEGQNVLNGIDASLKAEVAGVLLQGDKN